MRTAATVLSISRSLENLVRRKRSCGGRRGLRPVLSKLGLNQGDERPRPPRPWLTCWACGCGHLSQAPPSGALVTAPPSGGGLPPTSLGRARGAQPETAEPDWRLR